jgi:hypothetical protein
VKFKTENYYHCLSWFQRHIETVKDPKPWWMFWKPSGQLTKQVWIRHRRMIDSELAHYLLASDDPLRATRLICSFAQCNAISQVQLEVFDPDAATDETILLGVS